MLESIFLLGTFFFFFFWSSGQYFVDSIIYERCSTAIIFIYAIVDHPSTKENNCVSENYYVQIIAFPSI